MKSILSNKCCEKKEKPFPKLMIASGDNPREGLVILFSERGAGTVVHVDPKDEHPYRIGERSCTWTPEYYSDYEGDVCLTNDD